MIEQLHENKDKLRKNKKQIDDVKTYHINILRKKQVNKYNATITDFNISGRIDVENFDSVIRDF